MTATEGVLPPVPPRPLILMVDDDADILSVLAGVLSRGLPTVRIRSETSPAAALASLGRDAPAVIMADYRMPGMDGIQFLERARLLAPGAKMILLTGQPDRFAVEMGTARNITVLSKPIEPGLFLTMIEHWSRAGAI